MDAGDEAKSEGRDLVPDMAVVVAHLHKERSASMQKGTVMGFILGFLIGILAAIVLFGLLVFWLCSRPNSVAVSKFISGIAQALAHRKHLPDQATPEGKTDSTEDALLTRNSK
jgi:hypothetical protein